MVEHAAVNRVVVGSSPTSGASLAEANDIPVTEPIDPAQNSEALPPKLVKFPETIRHRLSQRTILRLRNLSRPGACSNPSERSYLRNECPLAARGHRTRCGKTIGDGLSIGHSSDQPVAVTPATARCVGADTRGPFWVL